MTENSNIQQVVGVIDDDESVRNALQGLFRSVGLEVRAFCSVRDYLERGTDERVGCLVLDIRLPGRSGLEFLEALSAGGSARSVVLISAHVDVQMAVRAMKAGAVDVLTKPVREQDLLEAVNRALANDAKHRAEQQHLALLRSRYTLLSERERQVMTLVAAGLLNKQIAERVKITEATVKLHRGQVMRKMDVASVPELVRAADALALGGSARD